MLRCGTLGRVNSSVDLDFFALPKLDSSVETKFRDLPISAYTTTIRAYFRVSTHTYTDRNSGWDFGHMVGH